MASLKGLQYRISKLKRPRRFKSAGDFASIKPISEQFGFDRGTPIDRFYINAFLSDHKSCVLGRCLEVAEDMYTSRFGEERVTSLDLIHATGIERPGTIVGDLTNLTSVEDNTYDCIILTQTLQFIFDMPAVVHELYRVLKPGGHALVTCNCISQISRYDMDRWGDYWRLTSLGARRLFEQSFASENITISTYGNTASAVAFLEGLAAEELSAHQLSARHPDYEVLIGVDAMKPKGD